MQLYLYVLASARASSKASHGIRRRALHKPINVRKRASIYGRALVPRSLNASDAKQPASPPPSIAPSSPTMALQRPLIAACTLMRSPSSCSLPCEAPPPSGVEGSWHKVKRVENRVRASECRGWGSQCRVWGSRWHRARVAYRKYCVGFRA